MKRNIILTICILALIGTSCTSKKETELREQHLKDSFNTLLTAKTQEAQTMAAQLNDIDNNLMQITSQYAELRQITNQDGNIAEDKVKHIGIQINAMAELLQKEKQRLSSMRAQIAKQKKNDANTTELEKKITELNAKITTEENQITSLTQELKDKNIKIDNLSNQVTKLQEESKKNKAEISKLEDERYTAYFYVGTKKELKAAGLINEKGGFIGIGKTITMAKNSNVSAMQKIDIRNVNEIPLTGAKIEILTPHPLSSYALQGSSTKPSSLLITSVSDFWQVSRCLVIMVK